MAQKPRTEKQLANDKRLADAAKQRRAEREITTAPELSGDKTEVDVAQSSSPTDMLLMRLMNEIDELKKAQKVQPSPEAALETIGQMQQPTVGKNGLQGQIFKWSVDASYYPSPIERLYDEPTLRRFNLRDNYFFDWEVSGVEYEKHNISYAEPRFTIRIFRRIFDDDGVTPNGQMALINKHIQHEDELVARIAADKLGLREQFPDFRELMDEVRFLRIRQWLLYLFAPPSVNQYQRRARQMVIDGKVVEMFDTETLIDGEVGKSKASSVSRETRI